MEWDAFRHPGRKGVEQPVLEQLERLHLAAIIRESEKHAVELPAMERIAGRLAGFLAAEQLEVRPFAAQLRQQGGEQERGDGGDDGHPPVRKSVVWGKRLASMVRSGWCPCQ